MNTTARPFPTSCIHGFASRDLAELLDPTTAHLLNDEGRQQAVEAREIIAWRKANAERESARWLAERRQMQRQR